MTEPAVILVRPQLGENIGAAARAMANFALRDLRIVSPRDGWPNPAAQAMAANGVHILDGARLFASVREATGDLQMIWATTARYRDMRKPVDDPETLVRTIRSARKGIRHGILFGPERSGLNNDEVAAADRIVTIPCSAEHPSINLAQAVLLTGYLLFRERENSQRPDNSPAAATHEDLELLFDHLFEELENCGFLRNKDQRPVIVRNLRTLFLRAALDEQEVRTLRGVIKCLSRGRRAIPGQTDD